MDATLAAGTTVVAERGDFTGRRWPLLKLAVKNAVLILLTLGIYRFWAKTRVRQYFWSNVKLAGDSFEYTGTPNELLKGFLVAVAVLAPFGLVYHFGTEFMVGVSLEALALFNLFYYFVIYLLIQLAFYRMWRYRLTRTQWRGVRFDLDGSSWLFVFISVLWSFGAASSMGVLVPFMRDALMRYRIENTRLGNTRFAFDGRPGHLMKAWVPTLLAPIAVMIFAIAIDPQGLFVSMEAMMDPDSGATPRPPLVFLLLLPAMMVWGIMFVWYRVYEFRYMVGATRFGKARFTCSIRTPTIVGLAILAGVLALVLGGAVVTAIGALGTPFVRAIGPDIGGPAIGIVSALVFLVLFSVIQTVVFRYGVVRNATVTTRVTNPEALADAVQATGETPRRGEGLADALDVGAF